MITVGIATIIGLLWAGHRWGFLAMGSVFVGMLVGLVFASTSVGAPLATAVSTSATAIGTSIRTGLNGVIK